MLVTADLHLREESAPLVLGQVLPGLFDLARQNNQRVVAILGDLWHLRHQVPVALLNAVKDALKQCGLGVWFLPGNHDQVDVHGRNALEVLDELSNVRVFTEPTINEAGAWLPYRQNHEELVAWARNLHGDLVKAGCPEVLYFHGGIRGATMNNAIFDDTGIPLEELAPWEAVVCGHYHRSQVVGNARYVGSPWQTKADEAGQEKGVWVVPDAAPYTVGDMRFISTHWGPRYHLIELGPGQGLDMTGIRPEDIVRVSTAAGVDVAGVGQQLTAAGITHTITPEVVATDARLDLAPGSGMDAYAKAYVELQKGDLPEEGLLAVFNEIQSRCGGVA